MDVKSKFGKLLLWCGVLALAMPRAPAGLRVFVLALAIVTWFSKRVDHLLILCFTIANYVATIGQNRFGYYLVPSTAVVIAWLATRVLDLGGVPHADNRPTSRTLNIGTAPRVLESDSVFLTDTTDPGAGVNPEPGAGVLSVRFVPVE